METVFTPLSVTVIESSLLAGSSPSLEAGSSPFSLPVLGVSSSLSQHALGSTFEQMSGAS